jgi:hypothetical protein
MTSRSFYEKAKFIKPKNISFVGLLIHIRVIHMGNRLAKIFSNKYLDAL